MKKDQPTIDGILWAANYLLEHPKASWVELQQHRPPGIKLWKGMMGVVRTYQATGTVSIPDSPPRRREPKDDEPVIPALQRAIGSMAREIETLKVRLAKLGV